MGTFYTPPEKGVQKHLFWLVSLIHLPPAFFNLPSVIGVQCLPGSYTESFVLLQPCHPLSSCTLHNRRGWIHFICWRHCYVRGYHFRLIPFLSPFLNLLRNDKYLTLGGPLLAGVTVVALSSLAPMIIPMGIRALTITESISLYGGLAVFGGFVLYEYVYIRRHSCADSQMAFSFSTQKILKHARMAEQGLMTVDPINESISLELDMINILFVTLFL